MILTFQKEFRIIVLEAEDMEMQIFCALTNSNIKFIGAARNFVEKVQRFALLPEEEILTVVLHN